MRLDLLDDDSRRVDRLLLVVNADGESGDDKNHHSSTPQSAVTFSPKMGKFYLSF